MKKEHGLGLLLILLCAVTSYLNPKFLSAVNLSNMANLIGMFGIFSIGLGMVIITGGIDLSVGAICALSGVLLAISLREWHLPWPLAIALVLLLCMGLGLIHALLVTRLKLQPFIITLSGLLIYRGLARFISQDTTKGFGNAEHFEALRNFCQSKIAGVPTNFLLFLGIALIMGFLLHRSVYGRHLMAVGRNEQAALFSGIRTRFVIGTTYVLCGLLTGISAILFAFYTNSISASNHGNSYELYGIAAAVLGGCSLRGGEGSIIGIMIGAALLQVLQNLVNLLGIPSSLNFAVMGGVVLLGVIMDQLLHRHHQRTMMKKA
jgi:ribose transport system permease protein